MVIKQALNESSDLDFSIYSWPKTMKLDEEILIFNVRSCGPPLTTNCCGNQQSMIDSADRLSRKTGSLRAYITRQNKLRILRNQKVTCDW